jgi:hypothetical protein
MQVEPEGGLVQLGLVQDVFVSKVQLGLVGSTHQLIGQLLHLLGLWVHTLIVEELSKRMEDRERVVLCQY